MLLCGMAQISPVRGATETDIAVHGGTSGGLIAAVTAAQSGKSTDIAVYGGTSGGVIAAITAAQSGKSVVLVSPTKRLGGLSSGGLGWTDVGRVSILGGLSREFYHRVWEWYQKPEAWTEGGQINKDRGPQGKAVYDEYQLMVVFEPKVAERIFNDWLAQSGVRVEFGRLDLDHGVTKEGARIVSFRTLEGREYRAKIFIDATYEGDLMAKAGVSYTVGREPSSQYNESLNGQQMAKSVKNQLPAGIDPYVVKGDPSSGLLPGVNPTPVLPDGSGDRHLQAYCYRMCLTTDPENRIPIVKPVGYREEDYELLFRAIEARYRGPFFRATFVPNRKTDSNNDGGISTDFIGGNTAYPEGDYAVREKIAFAHETWQRGLLWTLQNHPRIPASIREEYAKWGLPKDEFSDNGNWTPTLYVREARRMVSDYVLTQSVAQNSLPSDRSVGLAAYAMDSHNVQRIVSAAGYVQNEGDVQCGVKKSYQVDYGVLVPRKAECENLFVPFCISASHIAFGSARMEPVFMILSESATIAAGLAIDHNAAVQDVPYPELKQKLMAAGQHLDP